MKEYIEALGRPAPDYRLVSREIDLCLEDNSIIEPPVPLQEMVENAGLRITFANFPAKLSNVMWFFDPNEQRIVVNRADAPNRQRFTIAHEFGHARMHREFIQNHPEGYQVLLRQPMGGAKDVIEKEANAFAAGLLVPHKFLAKFVKVATIAELARLFIVSEEVIRWRIKNEKLVLV